jgi:hypothetical protein
LHHDDAVLRGDRVAGVRQNGELELLELGERQRRVGGLG